MECAVATQYLFLSSQGSSPCPLCLEIIWYIWYMGCSEKIGKISGPRQGPPCHTLPCYDISLVPRLGGSSAVISMQGLYAFPALHPPLQACYSVHAHSSLCRHTHRAESRCDQTRLLPYPQETGLSSHDKEIKRIEFSRNPSSAFLFPRA